MWMQWRHWSMIIDSQCTTCSISVCLWFGSRWPFACCSVCCFRAQQAFCYSRWASVGSSSTPSPSSSACGWSCDSREVSKSVWRVSISCCCGIKSWLHSTIAATFHVTRFTCVSFTSIRRNAWRELLSCFVDCDRLITFALDFVSISHRTNWNWDFLSHSYLNTFLERTELNGQAIPEGWESRLDIDVNDVVIQGKSSTRVSRKQVCCAAKIVFECVCMPHQNEIRKSFFSSLIKIQWSI